VVPDESAQCSAVKATGYRTGARWSHDGCADRTAGKSHYGCYATIAGEVTAAVTPATATSTKAKPGEEIGAGLIAVMHHIYILLGAGCMHWHACRCGLPGVSPGGFTG